MTGRRGMALLATLWLIVAMAALAAGAARQARAGSEATASRAAALRQGWAAEGCLALAQWGIETDLKEGGSGLRPTLDTVHYSNGVRCSVELLDPGSRLHRDSAGAAARFMLDSALAASDSTAALEQHLTSHGDGRVNLSTADEHVLATLPGFGRGVVRAVIEARDAARPIESLDDLISRVSPADRPPLISNYPFLTARVTTRPTAIVLTATAWSTPGERAHLIEVFAVPAGRRLAIIYRDTR